MMTIEEQVNEGIKNAMKAREKVRLEAFRNIKKVILPVRVPATRLTMLNVSVLFRNWLNKVQMQLKYTNSKGGWICMRKNAGNWKF